VPPVFGELRPDGIIAQGIATLAARNSIATYGCRAQSGDAEWLRTKPTTLMRAPQLVRRVTAYNWRDGVMALSTPLPGSNTI